MYRYRRSPWPRIAVTALVAAAIPLLATFAAPPAPKSISGAGWPAPPGGSWERPGEIVVELTDGVTPADLERLAARTHQNLMANSPLGEGERVFRAHVAPADEAALLEALRSDPAVAAAEPLHLVTALWKPDDPRYAEQWNFRMIGMEKAWDVTKGKGAVVAIIDTGCALENDSKCYRAQDFVETKFVRGYDFIGKDDHPKDDNGHGTHVGGTVAESTDNHEGVAGIAFQAKLMPLKVLTAEGWGTSADIADAIRFAADHGANVINMSLGSPAADRVMESACKYAYKKGVAIVCAAGNSSREGVGFPAAFKECIAVSAVGPKGDLSYYSSWGKEIAIAAPGGDKTFGEQGGILQNTVAPDDGYYYFQGTSMASPHVAGVAALIVSRGVKNPDDIRAVLQKSAQPKEPKSKYGAGILDASAAVRAADETRDEPRFRFGFIGLLALAGLAVAGLRSRAAGMRRLPLAATALFALGALLPEWLTGTSGAASTLNMAGHSALLPLALLALPFADRRAFRYLAAIAAGVAVHLAWDAVRSAAPFSLEAGWRALPWLWVNVAVGVGVVVAALQKGYQKE